MISISVLIATSGRSPLLYRSLESLSGIEIPASLQEVIIVENGLKHNVEAIVNEFNGILPIRYLYSPVANKSAALNLALKSIPDNALVFFTDDDVRFKNDTLCVYHDAVLKHGGNHYFGGPLEIDYEKEPEDYLKKFFPPSAAGWTASGEKFIKKFLGINWAAFAGDIKKVGFFNENIGPGAPSGATGQEHDMQDRLFDHDVKPIFLSNALVWHYVPLYRSSFQWVIKRNYQKGVNYSVRKNFANRHKIFGIPSFLIKDFFAEIFKSLSIQALLEKEKRLSFLHNLAYAWGRLKGSVIKRNLEKA